MKISTQVSTSLPSRCSPRATEPNIPMQEIPYLAEFFRIYSRSKDKYPNPFYNTKLEI